MPTLKVYTRSQIGDKVVEHEIIVNEELTQVRRIEIIKLVLGIEDDEDRN